MGIPQILSLNYPLACLNAILLLFCLRILVHAQGISRDTFLRCFLPPVSASALVAYGLLLMEDLDIVPETLWIRLLAAAILFSLAYLGILRAAFPSPMRTLLEVAPGGDELLALFGFKPRPLDFRQM